MAEILFYEKPGCINGEKQKRILAAAGHTLKCRDILTTVWSVETLLPFLSSDNPQKIMNHTAPDIKNGKIIPEDLAFADAVQLMLRSPILIRRPLIVVEGKYIQGFDNMELKPYLGDWDGREDVLTCPNLATISCDEKKG